MSSRTDTKRLAEACGIHVATWSPGDGQTRYRFFVKDDPGGTDYFGGSYPLGTCLGAAEAYTWLQGYNACRLLTLRQLGEPDTNSHGGLTAMGALVTYLRRVLNYGAHGL